MYVAKMYAACLIVIGLWKIVSALAAARRNREEVQE